MSSLPDEQPQEPARECAPDDPGGKARERLTGAAGGGPGVNTGGEAGEGTGASASRKGGKRLVERRREALRPGARPRGVSAAFRSLPFVIMGILIASVLGIRILFDLLREGGEGREPGRAEPAWLPLGSGTVEFLSAASSFRIFRRSRGEGFRVDGGDVAVEGPRLEGIVRVYLRDKLAAVQPGETIRVGVSRGSGLPPGPPEQGRRGIDWRMTFREERRGEESWYRIESPPLDARTTEDLKEKAAREFAREVLALFQGGRGEEG